MKASLDRSGCIACGLCPTICPEVFRMADDGLAEVYNETVPPKPRIEPSRRRKAVRSR